MTEIWVPDACTLPTAERPARSAEFAEVFATAVRVERLSDRHARLHLAGPDGLAGTVADLAARETRCCSFFTFTVTPAAPGAVVFDIQVPAAHVSVLDAMLAGAGAPR
jgi:hypothetical protein